jgi:hypothetical protein
LHGFDDVFKYLTGLSRRGGESKRELEIRNFVPLAYFEVVATEGCGRPVPDAVRSSKSNCSARDC